MGQSEEEKQGLLAPIHWSFSTCPLPPHPTPPHPRSALRPVLGPGTRENHCIHRLIAPAGFSQGFSQGGHAGDNWGMKEQTSLLELHFWHVLSLLQSFPPNPPASMSPTLFNPRNTASFLSRLTMVTASCCCWSLGTSVSLVCPFDTPPHFVSRPLTEVLFELPKMKAVSCQDPDSCIRYV